MSKKKKNRSVSLSDSEKIEIEQLIKGISDNIDNDFFEPEFSIDDNYKPEFTKEDIEFFEEVEGMKFEDIQKMDELFLKESLELEKRKLKETEPKLYAAKIYKKTLDNVMDKNLIEDQIDYAINLEYNDKLLNEALEDAKDLISEDSKLILETPINLLENFDDLGENDRRKIKNINKLRKIIFNNIAEKRYQEMAVSSNYTKYACLKNYSDNLNNINFKDNNIKMCLDEVNHIENNINHIIKESSKKLAFNNLFNDTFKFAVDIDKILLLDEFNGELNNEINKITNKKHKIKLSSKEIKSGNYKKRINDLNNDLNKKGYNDYTIKKDSLSNLDLDDDDDYNDEEINKLFGL